MKKLFAFLLVILFTLNACKKDKVDEPTTTPPPSTPANTTASILVNVATTAGVAISGATVVVGSQTATTNTTGIVYFSSALFSSGKNVIKVSKAGYFKANQTIEISNGNTYNISVTLTTKTVTGTFLGNAAATINATNGGSIDFTANSIVDNVGNPYTGTVNVSAVYIASNASNASAILPNSFLGLNSSSQQKFVENHGTIIVELEGNSGQALQIATGSTAQIHMPVSSQDLASPPSTIPFYYFDESTGYWKEDGVGTLTGGTEFVGTVSHFTWWMCPFVYNHYSLSGTIVCGATGMPGVKVAVYNVWGSYLGSVTTGPGGIFSGMIPDVITFDLKVKDICGTQVYTTAIGPFSSNTTMAATDISATANYGVITGWFKDCANATDLNSLCRVQSNGLTKFIAPLPSGYFNEAVLFCTGSTSAVVTGVNFTTNQVSIDTTMTITPTMNFGTKQVCNTASEYCTFVLAGAPKYYTENAYANFTGVLDNTANKIILNVTSGQFMNETHFNVSIPATVVGNHSVGGSPFAYSFVLSGNNGTIYLTVNLTSVGTTVGSAIEGTINNITFVDQGGASKTLSNCAFRILIDTEQ